MNPQKAPKVYAESIFMLFKHNDSALLESIYPPVYLPISKVSKGATVHVHKYETVRIKGNVACNF